MSPPCISSSGMNHCKNKIQRCKSACAKIEKTQKNSWYISEFLCFPKSEGRQKKTWSSFIIFKWIYLFIVYFIGSQTNKIKTHCR